MARALLAASILMLTAPNLAGQAYDDIAARVADDLRQRYLAEQELREKHSSWSDAWVVSTEHYRVRTTDSWLVGRDIAEGLEERRARFVELLAPPSPAPASTNAVFILPTIADYQKFGDDHGDARSSFYGSFHAGEHPEQPVATYRVENYTQLRMFATHAATLQLLARHFPNRSTPAWIDYGLASYFHLVWAYEFGVGELSRLEGNGQFIPLRDVLAIQVGANRSTLDGGNAHAHFMELGMLFWYLIHFREDTRSGEGQDPGPFAAYLRAALAGADVSDHPVHELLFERTTELEKELKAYEFPSAE